jgi:hypothetical protein
MNLSLPTQSDCLAFACGADATNLAGQYACAAAGMAQALSCGDPQCLPYCQDAQVLAAAMHPGTPVGVLTPDSVVPAIPTVTLQPAPVMNCGWWSALNADIEQNTLLSAALLAVLGIAVLSRKARR